jgi:hypothetical protein
MHQFKTAGEFVQFLATMAVSNAQQNNQTTLDYTPESIKTVETIFDGIHDQYVKNPSSVAPNELGSAYGAYIGEVVRRSEPGVRWERDDAPAGEILSADLGGRAVVPDGVVLQTHRERSRRKRLEQIRNAQTNQRLPNRHRPRISIPITS